MGAAIIELSNNTTINTQLNNLVQNFTSIYKQDPHFSDYQQAQIMLKRKDNKQEAQEVILTLKLRQIWELKVKEITADKEYEDPVTCEKGAAKMKCGHYYSRSFMRSMVQIHVKSQQFLRSEIMCGHVNVHDLPCNKVISCKEWTFIGGFKKSEVSQLNDLMSQNWLKSNTKLCPKCSVNVIKLGIMSSAVSCPSCNSGTFCYNCLEDWEGNDYNALCQTATCQFYRQQIINSKWTRKFRVKDLKTNVKIDVLTPTKRSCPRCKSIIENTILCKHTKCPCMNNQNSFCFICLGLYEKGKWPCGGYQDYCGLVAPVQSFN